MEVSGRRKKTTTFRWTWLLRVAGSQKFLKDKLAFGPSIYHLHFSVPCIIHVSWALFKLTGTSWLRMRFEKSRVRCIASEHLNSVNHAEWEFTPVKTNMDTKNILIVERNILFEKKQSFLVSLLVFGSVIHPTSILGCQGAFSAYPPFCGCHNSQLDRKLCSEWIAKAKHFGVLNLPPRCHPRMRRNLGTPTRMMVKHNRFLGDRGESQAKFSILPRIAS